MTRSENGLGGSIEDYHTYEEQDVDRQDQTASQTTTQLRGVGIA
jgi:hypothetical protein